MRKSKLLTFLFGMWPGAGQMYLGYMRRGVSLMGAFIGFLGLGAMLSLEILLIPLPIIWFYSFFDALNLRCYTYDDRYAPADDYLFHLDSLRQYDFIGFFQHRHLLCGILCICLGGYILLYSVVEPLLGPVLHQLFGISLWRLLRIVPSLVVALAIIWLGIHLIRGDRGFHRRYLEDDLHEYQEPGHSGEDFSQENVSHETFSQESHTKETNPQEPPYQSPFSQDNSRS